MSNIEQKRAKLAAALSAGNELGIDNIVAVAVNGVEVTRHIKEQLADGFQIWVDVPAIAFKDFGRLQLIAQVAPQALREIADLTPDEIEEVERLVSAETGLPSTGTIGEIRQVIRYAARVYRHLLASVDLFDEGRDLFNAIRA